MKVCAELTDARAVALDVTDPEAVHQAANQIGPIDGVTYNAGAYEPMRATEWDADAVDYGRCEFHRGFAGAGPSDFAVPAPAMGI